MTETVVEAAAVVGEGAGEPDDGTRRARSGGWGSWVRFGLIVVAVVAVGVLAGWPLLAIVGALVVSIVLHELGHFLVAKWAGMKVTEFFIGFGPRLWWFTRGETTYGLKLIPAGAYVRIIGMSNLERVDPSEEGRSYRSKPYLKRLAVVLAGPLANFLVAFVLLAVMLSSFGQTRADAWQVGTVVEGSTAAQIGLQPGDRLLELDGAPISTWESFEAAVDQAGTGPVEVVFERDGEQRSVTTPLGWRLDAEAAALLTGLEEGDQIVSVDGRPIATYESFAGALGSSGAATAVVELRRALGTEVHTYKTEVATPAELPPAGSKSFVGVSRASHRERLGVLEAVPEAGSTFGEIVGESVSGLTRFFSPSGLSRYFGLLADTATGNRATPEVPVNGLEPVSPDAPVPGAAANSSSGAGAEDRVVSIVGVVRLGAQAAEFHPSALILLVVVVNIFLGLLNLLPLPPLDGGHAAVATYEAIRGRLGRRPSRVDMARLMPVVYAVTIVLIALGVSSTYLDLANPVDSPFGG